MVERYLKYLFWKRKMAEETAEEIIEGIYIARAEDFEGVEDIEEVADENLFPLPTEQSAAEIYLLGKEQRPSLLYQPIRSRLHNNAQQDLRCFLSDDWYSLLEKLTDTTVQRIPHIILFPYDAQRNGLFLSTMYRSEEYFAEGRPRLRSALDACRIIAERKDNPKDFPWLYLFGAEMLPERTRWDHGVKKFFKTTDAGILAEALKEKVYEVLHWEVEQVRRKNFGSSWRRE